MRVLLVDDEVKFATSLQKVLQSEGYAVDVAHDGEDAYQMAGDEVYDLILLDVGMPKMNGLELCGLLRKEQSAVPILMLTARDATSDKILGLDAGADDYLVKPFEVDELLARMRSLLRRRSGDKSPILMVGTLKLNPASRRVERDGKAIELSAKEYALLEFLMRHTGHILSKQQILDHVWDGDMDPFSNVVDVYIGYLRAKVDRPFEGSNLIMTVKGLGYRIGD